MLASLIRHAAGGGLGVPGHAVEIVGAGDVLDLDPSYPRSGHPQGAADAIEATLTDHAELAAALRRASAAGCGVHLVAGNHDPAVATPQGRAAIQRVLGPSVAVWSWYFPAASGAHVEHGHLYDPANAGQADVTLGGIGARHAHLAFPGLDPEGIDSVHPREYARHALALVGADPAHARRAVLAGANFLRSASLVDEACVKRARGELLAQLGGSVQLEHGRQLAAVDRRHLELVAGACTPAEFTRARGWDGYHAGVVEELARASRRVQALRGAPTVIFGHVHRARDERTASGARLLNAGCWSERGGTFAIHNSSSEGTPTGVYAWGTP